MNFEEDIEEMTLSFEDMLRIHDVQLQNSNIPKIYWKTLFTKLQSEVFDAGEMFVIEKILDQPSVSGSTENYSTIKYPTPAAEKHQSVEVEDVDENELPHIIKTNSVMEEPTSDDEQGLLFSFEKKSPSSCSWKVIVNSLDGISSSDPNHVYIVDHSWSYLANRARKDLHDMPKIREQMAKLMDVEVLGKTCRQIVEDIAKKMWRFNHFYRVQKHLERPSSVPIWYVMDEFGSRIQHSDQPSVQIVPFHFIPGGNTYSVLWPLKDLHFGDELTWDFISPSGKKFADSSVRDILLMPWGIGEPCILVSEDDNDEEFLLQSRVSSLECEPDEVRIDHNRPSVLTVYTDVTEVKQGLANSTAFTVVDAKDMANILFLSDGVFTNSQVNTKFVNRLPHDCLLTDKALLSFICCKYSKMTNGMETPAWLQRTFCMEKQLRQFVSYFFKNENRDERYWIVKPACTSGGTDCIITDQLECILRLAVTGSKVACTYITDPVLCDIGDFSLVKFTLQYIALIQSVKPLQVYLHNDFTIKMAKGPFALGSFDNEDVHMAMHYPKETVSPKMFERAFEEHYLGLKWAKVQDDIHKVIKEMFVAVTASPAPAGLCHLPNCRAAIGIHIMLKWAKDDKGEPYIQPVILSCDSSPDLSHHVEIRPQFIEDIFHTLFLEQQPVTPLHQL